MCVRVDKAFDLADFIPSFLAQAKANLSVMALFNPTFPKILKKKISTVFSQRLPGVELYKFISCIIILHI